MKKSNNIKNNYKNKEGSYKIKLKIWKISILNSYKWLKIG